MMWQSIPARISLLAGLLALTTVPGRTQDQDWAQWRGPDGTGVSTEADWKVEGEVAWEREVGLGYSSVAVAAGLVYTQGWAGGEDTLLCMDAETGDELWAHSYPAKKMDKYHEGGTNVTPVVDDDRVFTCSREGRFLCLDSEGGDVIWEQDLKAEYGLEIPTWGFAGSALVLGDQVIVNMGKVLSFDRETGEKRWVTEGDLGHAYSTPALAKVGGKDCLAVFNGKGLFLIDPQDGREHCGMEWKTQYDVNAATPVILGDRAFISSGYNRGCAMVKLSLDGIEPVWESKVMKTHMAGVTLYDGHLYGFDEAVFKCVDLEGDEKWRQRGAGKGAHVIAGGRIVMLTGDGELVIAKASPEGFQELHRQDLYDEGVCWTPPVLAGGRLYCRNNRGTLICLNQGVDSSNP